MKVAGKSGLGESAWKGKDHSRKDVKVIIKKKKDRAAGLSRFLTMSPLSQQSSTRGCVPKVESNSVGRLKV